MSLYRYSWIVALAWFGSVPGLAAPTEAWIEAVGHLSGAWTGTLTYRDYRSNERVVLPHRRVVGAAPDGSFLTMSLEYDDPGRTVYGYELIVPATNGASTASTGRDQIWTQQSTLIEYEVLDDGWAARFEHAALDNGEPATIQTLWRMQAGQWSIETRVQKAEQAWFTRNRVDLERAE